MGGIAPPRPFPSVFAIAELAAKVRAGKLSANAAAIEARFRTQANRDRICRRPSIRHAPALAFWAGMPAERRATTAARTRQGEAGSALKKCKVQSAKFPIYAGLWVQNTLKADVCCKLRSSH